MRVIKNDYTQKLIQLFYTYMLCTTLYCFYSVPSHRQRGKYQFSDNKYNVTWIFEDENKKMGIFSIPHCARTKPIATVIHAMCALYYLCIRTHHGPIYSMIIHWHWELFGSFVFREKCRTIKKHFLNWTF